MDYLPRSWSCWWWASWWCRDRPTWCARLSPPAPTPSSGWPSPPPSGCWAPQPPGPSSSSYPCFSRPRAAETSKCIFVFWRMIQGHFKVVVFVSILEMKYPKIFEKNFKHVFLMSGVWPGCVVCRVSGWSEVTAALQQDPWTLQWSLWAPLFMTPATSHLTIVHHTWYFSATLISKLYCCPWSFLQKFPN